VVPAVVLLCISPSAFTLHLDYFPFSSVILNVTQKRAAVQSHSDLHGRFFVVIRKTFPMREQEGRAVLRAARCFQKEVPGRETKV